MASSNRNPIQPRTTNLVLLGRPWEAKQTGVVIYGAVEDMDMEAHVLDDELSRAVGLKAPPRDERGEHFVVDFVFLRDGGEIVLSLLGYKDYTKEQVEEERQRFPQLEIKGSQFQYEVQGLTSEQGAELMRLLQIRDCCWAHNKIEGARKEAENSVLEGLKEFLQTRR